MRIHADRPKLTTLYSIVFIFSIALVVRLLHIYEIYHVEPYYKQLILDSLAYDQWGREIAAGNVIGNIIYFQDPLYPYFLGLLYFIFGHNLTVVIIIQSLIGALSAVLMYLISKRLFNNAVGIIASLVWSCYPVMIFYESTVQKEGISVFLILLSIHLILRAMDELSNKYYLLGGICLGLSILTRGNILFVVPFIMACIIVKFGAKSVMANLSLLLGLLLVLFPVTLRNMIIGNEFVLTTSQAGTIFYIGNNASSVGSLSPIPTFMRANPRYERIDFENEAKRITGNNLTSSQVSRFWFKQSLDFIIEHPGRYSMLLLKKLNLLINNTEINDNYNYYYYKRFSTILSYSPVTYCLIVSLGILGIIISLGTWRKYTLVYAYIISYIVSLLLFYVIGRYRLQLIPFVIIFASASIYWLWQKLTSQEYYKFVSAIILVTVLWNVSMKDIEWVSAANNADILLFEAMRMRRIGDYDNATKKYLELVNTNRGLDQAHYGLAEIYYQKRQLDLAINEYRKALEGRLTSNSALTRFKLGIALLDAHRGDEAMQEFKSSIAIDPEQVGSYFELARYYEDRGMLSASLEYWKELLAHDKSGSSTTLAKTKIADLTQKTYH